MLALRPRIFLSLLEATYVGLSGVSFFFLSLSFSYAHEIAEEASGRVRPLGSLLHHAVRAGHVISTACHAEVFLQIRSATGHQRKRGNFTETEHAPTTAKKACMTHSNITPRAFHKPVRR
jgi:hypothetical protein